MMSVGTKGKIDQLATNKVDFGVSSFFFQIGIFVGNFFSKYALNPNKSEKKYKEVAEKRLGIIPDQCPQCKTGILEFLEVILPLRGPPLFASSPKPQIFTC